jgi:hypothetical protein
MQERIAVVGPELPIPAVFVRRHQPDLTPVVVGGATIGAFLRPGGGVCRERTKIRARDARPDPYACAQPGQLLCKTQR